MQRLAVTGKKQRRRQYRLRKRFEQREDDRVMRDADTDRAALRVLCATRHLARRAQHERECATAAPLHNMKLRIVHPREAADLGKIAANERQVMTLIDAS